jgi:hypothetical protein
MRRCTKKTGPFESSTINRLTIGNTQGNAQQIKISDKMISKHLFSKR